MPTRGVLQLLQMKAGAVNDFMPSFKMTVWTEQLRTAREQISTLQTEHPEELLLTSVHRQLDYLLDVAEGTADDTKLETINVGRLAMYPLVDLLPDDLCNLLCEISGKVRRDLKRQGRKSLF
jgi:hypothetical protein